MSKAPRRAKSEKPGTRPRLARTPRSTITSTEAQNEFGRLMEEASQEGEVVITKHGHPKAVLLSVARYEELQERESASLAALSGQFDEMLAHMQTTQSRDAVNRLFDASPEDLGEAALDAKAPDGLRSAG